MFYLRCYSGIVKFGIVLQPIFLLVIRLYWGYLFIMAGLGKFNDLQVTATMFASFNFPWPMVFAYIVPIVELVGGFLVLIGLVSRLASIFLSILLFTALFTAHITAVQSMFIDPHTFSTQLPIPFLMTTLTVLCFGPGLISFDYFIKRKAR